MKIHTDNKANQTHQTWDNYENIHNSPPRNIPSLKRVCIGSQRQHQNVSNLVFHL